MDVNNERSPVWFMAAGAIMGCIFGHLFVSSVQESQRKESQYIPRYYWDVQGDGNWLEWDEAKRRGFVD